MKIKYALLAALLTIPWTSPMFAQGNLDDTTRIDTKQPDMSTMMGKPTADATVEGLHMKVWLMTQEQHKDMMKATTGQRMMHGEKEGEMGRMVMRGMDNTSMATPTVMKGLQHDRMVKKDTSMKTDKDVKGMVQGGRSMNKATMDSMTAGTHHIRLDVTDAASGIDISNASARILIVSPSEKKSSADLTRMVSHFGGALTLDEGGEYRFTVTVNVSGVSRATQFQYTVK